MHLANASVEQRKSALPRARTLHTPTGVKNAWGFALLVVADAPPAQPRHERNELTGRFLGLAWHAGQALRPWRPRTYSISVSLSSFALVTPLKLFERGSALF
jgi:hypothetical protein